MERKRKQAMRRGPDYKPVEIREYTQAQIDANNARWAKSTEHSGDVKEETHPSHRSE